VTEFLDKNLHLCIPPIKPFQKGELGLSEMLVEIDGDKFSVLEENPSQDELRFRSSCGLLPYISPPKCRFVLNMYEGVYDERPQRFAYTAKPNSGHILIPDSHNFATAAKIEHVLANDIPFSAKNKTAVFAGSDTGNRRSDGWTMRSLVSAKYKDSSLVKSKLTFLDADTASRLEGKVSVSEIYAQPMSLDEQLKSQVILNINGNSTSWERLLWAMASNSLCVFVKPFDGEEMYSWYYPLLEIAGVVPFVEYDRLEKFMTNDFSSDYWQNKISAQKEFSKYVGNLNIQAKLLGMILEEYSKVNS